MHRIKIRQLETLMVFMKTGSVTEAAELLGTTQPNASKALKQIEDAIGIPLFKRMGGRLHATPEAEIIYSHVVRLMDNVEYIERLSMDLAQLKRGQLRIATLATFGVALLPAVTASFNATHPDVGIQIDVVDSEKIHVLVGREVYDFGLVHHPEVEEELHAQTLGAGEMVCLLPRTHPLAQQASIKVSELARYEVITYPGNIAFGSVVASTFADAGARLRKTISANHSLVVRKLVERTGRAAIVDEFSVWDADTEGPLAIRRLEPRIPVAIGLIAPSRRPLSKAAEAFIVELQGTLATLSIRNRRGAT
ncbi:LysR family transcriptional regulator [Caenimonas soli]|uniref:LysR family transcriptional regulator n=1 Tax=Caenimonas soli TaxID=2735555 RepID=UPI0015539001|nr:LysR family transcriptional regulator [Caenimonas soli]NPC58334.1 LysR family transcriptional regulator [Caenimonas soli]